MSWRDKIAAVLAGKVGGPTPSGIHVYHSSPHDFDRFDLSKIGTGEGAQVYGHGIYAAENPKVSGQGGQYWEQFRGRLPPDEQSATKLLQQHEFDRAKAADDVQKYIDTMQRYIRDPANAQDALLPAYERGLPAYRRQLELLQSGAPVGPRTYEVNFKAKPEELLDWDKPLAGQPAYQRLREHWDAKIGDPDIIAQRLSMGEAPTGAKLYQSLTGIGRNQPAASAQLNEAGIPGIRYLDEGSRVTGPAANNFAAQFGSRPEAHAAAQRSLASASDVRDVRKWEDIVADLARPQTHNYVAFDPSKLDIMAKYGVVGGVPLGAATMGGTIDQSTYGERQ